MEMIVGSNLKMAKTLIDRYFCHYENLEEYKFGMWRRPKAVEFDRNTSEARSFMMDVDRFSRSMSEVCDEWVNSCKVNFTTPSINPVAWLGQAAVCHALCVPESCTRAAWVQLPFEIQERANASAKGHIAEWMADQIGQGELFNV